MMYKINYNQRQQKVNIVLLYDNQKKNGLKTGETHSLRPRRLT